MTAATTLEALLDRLIPVDAFPGGAFVAPEVAVRLRERGPELGSLLERLRGFELLEAKEQDAALRELEAEKDAGFSAFVELAHSVYYADSRSWPGIGYTTNVPGRP